MSSNRGCFFNTLLFLIIVLIPGVGHIIETVMIIQDDHTPVDAWMVIAHLAHPICWTATLPALWATTLACLLWTAELYSKRTISTANTDILIKNHRAHAR